MVRLKSVFQQGLSEPEFHGDCVYKLRKIVSRADFSDQLRKVTMRFKRIGYNINVMQHSAYLVINTITIDSFASPFNCTPVSCESDLMMDPILSYLIYLSWLVPHLVLSVTWSFGIQLVVFFCSVVSVVLFHTRGFSRCHNTLFLSSPHL